MQDCHNCNDIELVYQVKNNNSSDALKELELRHSGICHQMIKRYQNVLLNSGFDLQDISEDKTYIIYKSALNFDPDKNVKFSTWLGNQMRYHCLNLINKTQQAISMNDENIKNILEKKQIQAREDLSILDKDKADFIFEILSQMKDKRMIKIFKLRYFNKSNKTLSWHNIGKRLKLSTQTVINIHNKALKLINIKMNSQNSFDKI